MQLCSVGVLAALAAAVPGVPNWVLAVMAELHLQVGVLAVSAAVPAHLLPCLFAAVLADLHHDGCLNLWPAALPCPAGVLAALAAAVLADLLPCLPGVLAPTRPKMAQDNRNTVPTLAQHCPA